MATIDLGKLGFVNKGTYNNSTTYEKNDLVQFTDGGILSTYLYIDSTAQSGQAPSSSGTVGSRWVYFAKGVADAIAGAGNNKVLVTDGSGSLSPLSIGSANQILQVNSGANGFEFTAKPEGKVKQIVTGVNGSGSTTSSVTTNGYSGGSIPNVGVAHITVNITPVSSTSKLVIMANAPSGTGGNGTGLAGVFVDNACLGAVSTNGYSADASGVSITCFAQNSSTSQRTVEFRTIGEWTGNALTLGQIRNGHTTSFDSIYGSLIVMEVE